MYISTNRDAARACAQKRSIGTLSTSYQILSKGPDIFTTVNSKNTTYTNTLPALERSSDGERSQYHERQQIK